MGSLLIFLAVLTVLVLVHECGHFFAARFFGVKAEEFGVGFPPRALGFVRDKGKWKRVKTRLGDSYPSTIWSINWLPLGGFVRMKGEDGVTAGERDSFGSKPTWQRFIILAAGVTMNFLLAALIFSTGFIVGIPASLEQLPPGSIVADPHIQITQVLEGAAADKAGMKSGDYLVSMDGKTLVNVEETQRYLSTHEGLIQAEVLRNGEQKQLQVMPEYLEALKRPALGIAMSDVGTVRLPWYRAIPQGFVTTFSYTKAILFAFGNIVRDLVVRQQVAADVSGPVGIAVMTGKIADQGAWSLFQFAALLSINLAVVNFLPIPALDGGRAIFVILESIRRRKVNQVFEARLHQVGFALLLLLIVLVTAKDLRQFGPMIWAGMKGLVGF